MRRQAGPPAAPAAESVAADGSRCTPERLKACKAYCCHIGFNLTDQEARAGFARWHPDFPYHILQVGPEARCAHLDPDRLRCRIYEHRPQPCRHFDCRGQDRPPAQAPLEQSLSTPGGGPCEGATGADNR